MYRSYGPQVFAGSNQVLEVACLVRTLWQYSTCKETGSYVLGTLRFERECLGMVLGLVLRILGW